MCTAMYSVALGEPMYGEVYAVLALKFFFFTVGFLEILRVLFDAKHD